MWETAVHVHRVALVLEKHCAQLATIHPPYSSMQHNLEHNMIMHLAHLKAVTSGVTILAMLIQKKLNYKHLCPKMFSIKMNETHRCVGVIMFKCINLN